MPHMSPNARLLPFSDCASGFLKHPWHIAGVDARYILTYFLAIFAMENFRNSEGRILNCSF